MTVLFVIATMIIFLTADWFVRRLRGRATSAERTPIQALPLRLPEGIFFAPSHTWLSLFPSGKVRLGIDDFIARLVDSPVITLLKRPGDEIRKGDPVMLLKNGSRFLTIRSPLDGKILASNDELPENPTLLKDRLFSDGWGYVIKPKKLSEIKNMLLGQETKAWIGNEFRRLRDLFASGSASGSLQPAYLQDGGMPVDGALQAMDDAMWQEFDHEFLKVQ